LLKARVYRRKVIPGEEVNGNWRGLGIVSSYVAVYKRGSSAVANVTKLRPSGIRCRINKRAIYVVPLVTYDLWVPLPNVTTWERYVGWRATVGTAVFTGGTLSIEYAANNRNYRAYPAQGNM